MLLQLIAIVLGTLVSEDFACIAAGVLAAEGKLTLLTATSGALFGIVAGDILLLLAGRYAGDRLLASAFVRRWINTAKFEQASEWLRTHAAKAILASRFTPGMRLPIYVAAGAAKANLLRSIALFIVAAALWTPLLVGSAAFFGREIIERALSDLRVAALAIVLVAAMAFGVRACVRHFADWKNRRRVYGTIQRRLRWEFWPIWAVYPPVVAYILYLGVRHRCFALFTAANPGMFAGGLVGESKSEILAHLAASGALPMYAVIGTHDCNVARCQQVQSFLNANGLSFPVVLKPDVGERGDGVAVVRSDDEVRNYFHDYPALTIAQEYVPGVEFGIFYARRPGEPRGRILSITHKQFPSVVGDGVRTVEEFILADNRAVCIAPTYLNILGTKAFDIPAAAERVQLVELGSHCRGSIFVDAMHLRSDALEHRIDEVSRTFDGFYFGRYDIRAESIEALQRGEFRVIELNGVTGEPVHIYDPKVSLIDAYRALFRHWALAFEIGAANASEGSKPMSLRSLWNLVRCNDPSANHPRRGGLGASFATSVSDGVRAELSAPLPLARTSSEG